MHVFIADLCIAMPGLLPDPALPVSPWGNAEPEAGAVTPSRTAKKQKGQPTVYVAEVGPRWL